MHSFLTARRLPVRWRLTLWFAALLALAMALFGGMIYVVLRQQLYDSFDEQLLNQAALTLAAVRVEDGAPTLEPSVANVADGEYFLRLLDADGATVFETGGNAAGVPLDQDVITAALAGRTAYSAAQDEDNETLRLISVPVRPDERGKVTSPASSRSASTATRSTSRWRGYSCALTLPARWCCCSPPPVATCWPAVPCVRWPRSPIWPRASAPATCTPG